MNEADPLVESGDLLPLSLKFTVLLCDTVSEADREILSVLVGEGFSENPLVLVVEGELPSDGVEESLMSIIRMCCISSWSENELYVQQNWMQ